MPNYAEQLKQYRWSCQRALNGHGNKSAAALLDEIPRDLGVDRYGEGRAVTALEDEVRTALGKPAAVFMPSGTMAQQIALRIHADQRGVRACAFHPTCHLDLYEENAYARLHGLKKVTVGDARRLMTLADLQGVRERLAAVLFELPQREIGGLLPPWADLEEQVAFVRTQGAAVHMDGARFWECIPYYAPPAAIAALFDTVYVSFYKGLGGLAGCCLAGEEEVIAEARVWRRRHGGTLCREIHWLLLDCDEQTRRTRLRHRPDWTAAMIDEALADARVLRHTIQRQLDTGQLSPNAVATQLLAWLTQIQQGRSFSANSTGCTGLPQDTVSSNDLDKMIPIVTEKNSIYGKQ